MTFKALPYSARMGSRIAVYDGVAKVAVLEVSVLRQGLGTVQEASEAVVTGVLALEAQYKEACDRLFDMLLGDDGEAFSQAERFIKAHRPDLYDRIGLGTDRVKATGDLLK